MSACANLEVSKFSTVPQLRHGCGERNFTLFPMPENAVWPQSMRTNGLGNSSYLSPKTNRWLPPTPSPRNPTFFLNSVLIQRIANGKAQKSPFLCDFREGADYPGARHYYESQYGKLLHTVHPLATPNFTQPADRKTKGLPTRLLWLAL